MSDWMPGYANRKRIAITGESGAGTLYQVLLSIGNAAGGDFHLENKCQSFPDDIRFTSADGTTQLSYWIEDATADPIRVWVRVADNLDTDKTIYVYYNNASATTTSNGEGTFLFFDDFSAATLDTDKWHEGYWSGAAGSSAAIVAGRLRITNAEDTKYAVWAKVAHRYDTGIVEGEIEVTNKDANYRIGILGFGYDDNHQVGVQHVYSGGAKIGLNWTNPTVGGGSESVVQASKTAFVKVIRTGSISKGYYKLLRTDNWTAIKEDLTDNMTAIGAMCYGYDNEIAYYDNVRIRKYAATEPAWASTDAEETP